MKTIPLVLLAFFIGSVGGWFTGEPDPGDSTTSEGPKISKRQVNARAARAKAGIPADVAARLARINAASTPAERLRATIHLARTLPVSEFGRWYDHQWLKFAGDMDTTMFYEITRNRWMEEDPEGLFDRARSRKWSNLTKIAENWARRDSERALAYAEDLTNPNHRNDFKLQLLGGLATSSPALFLEVAGTVATDSYQLKRAMKQFAESHPGVLAAADLPPELRRLADYSLAHVGFKKDFSAEFARLSHTPGGAAIFLKVIQNEGEFSKSFTDGIFNHLHQMPTAWLNELNNASWSLVGNNPIQWLDLDLAALGMNSYNIRVIQNDAWTRLASTDPEAALRRLAHSDINDQRVMQYTLQALQSLHRKDPAAAETWRGRLIASAPNEEYAERIGADLAQQPTGDGKPTLDTLREKLSAVRGQGRDFPEFQYTLRDATPEVSRAIMAEIAAMDVSRQAEIGHALFPSSQAALPHATQALLLEAMIRLESEKEFRPSNAPEKIAGKLAATWVAEEPVAAVRWAASLPAGELRQWTLRNLVAAWRPLDTPNADSWLRQLPPSDQADVREFLRITPQ